MPIIKDAAADLLPPVVLPDRLRYDPNNPNRSQFNVTGGAVPAATTWQAEKGRQQWLGGEIPAYDPKAGPVALREAQWMAARGMKMPQKPNAVRPWDQGLMDRIAQDHPTGSVAPADAARAAEARKPENIAARAAANAGKRARALSMIEQRKADQAKAKAAKNAPPMIMPNSGGYMGSEGRPDNTAPAKQLTRGDFIRSGANFDKLPTRKDLFGDELLQEDKDKNSEALRKSKYGAQGFQTPEQQRAWFDHLAELGQQIEEGYGEGPVTPQPAFQPQGKAFTSVYGKMTGQQQQAPQAAPQAPANAGKYVPSKQMPPIDGGNIEAAYKFIEEEAKAHAAATGKTYEQALGEVMQAHGL